MVADHAPNERIGYATQAGYADVYGAYNGLIRGARNNAANWPRDIMQMLNGVTLQMRDACEDYKSMCAHSNKLFEMRTRLEAGQQLERMCHKAISRVWDGATVAQRRIVAVEANVQEVTRLITLAPRLADDRPRAEALRLAMAAARAMRSMHAGTVKMAGDMSTSRDLLLELYVTTHEWPLIGRHYTGIDGKKKWKF